MEILRFDVAENGKNEEKKPSEDLSNTRQPKKYWIYRAILPSTRAQGSNIFDLPVVNLKIGGNPRFQIDHGSWGWT